MRLLLFRYIFQLHLSISRSKQVAHQTRGSKVEAAASINSLVQIPRRNVTQDRVTANDIVGVISGVLKASTIVSLSCLSP